MNTITVKDHFIINGKETKIISGALHYFRIVREHWDDSLNKLKEMGCNTVETYVPWNFHETQEGEFDFKTTNHDIEGFIRLAEEKGLYVIVRPSPYICAEWEFGGLPYWLLTKDVRIRTSDPKFIALVSNYYEKLFAVLTPLQWTQNGPVIMMQVENEYGSFGNDKDYLKAIHQLMKDNGVEVPMFTSDGAWEEALEAGYLPDAAVFPTGNFGSSAETNVKALKDFMADKNIHAPIMCMEFWDGWFNRWGEDVIKRDPAELQTAVKEMLNLGSINLYLFQGGTNFGFMNGSSARGTLDLHQVTSYDYDAPLTEWGDRTEKYHLLKELLTGSRNAQSPDSTKVAYKAVSRENSVSLFNTLDALTEAIPSKWTLPMEDLGQGYGYILYRANVGKKRQVNRVRVVEASDRIKLYVNEKEAATQMTSEIGEELSLDLPEKENNLLSILVENMGRVNYGSKLFAPTQKKGIRNGVMLDLHFHSDWDHYCLDLTNIEDVDFSHEYKEGPGFHKYLLSLDEEGQDTFIDCRGFGKGTIFINGFNIGRFWEKGPIHYLYVPGPLLRKGKNEIVVFETEGKFTEELVFSDKPIYK